MRRGVHRWGFLSVFLVWALAAVFALPASAARARLYSLPLATHGYALAVDPDRAVWFVGSYGSRHEGGVGGFVGRLAPDGTVSEFPLPYGGAAGAPSIGPDRDVWFPELYEDDRGYATPRVGRISNSDQLREYSLGNEEGQVSSVAAMNGDLWFAATHGSDTGVRSTIGRIATSVDDAVNEFALRPDCFAGAITAAARAIWFTESCRPGSNSGRVRPSAAIGRIDSAGEIVRYPLAARDFPVSITADPKGTVWFGVTRYDSSAPRIGRITPTGDFAEYRVPHSWPMTIAVGPNNRLWFPSTFGGAVLRALRSIDKRGRLGKPICFDPSCRLEANGLASSPDGRMWFSARKASSPGGGGTTGIIEDENIANEAGIIGRLAL